jgi:hypothetical protein
MLVNIKVYGGLHACQCVQSVWRATCLSISKCMEGYMSAMCSECMEGWTSKISAASGDSHSMWRTVNNFLGEEKSISVPVFSASDYHDCVDKKIADIRAGTASAADPTYVNNDVSRCFRFAMVDANLVASVIAASPAKQCPLDSLPTWLLKDCALLLAPSVTNIANASVTSGHFPSQWRHALVTPLLKKIGLDSPTHATTVRCLPSGVYPTVSFQGAGAHCPPTGYGVPL